MFVADHADGRDRSRTSLERLLTECDCGGAFDST